MTASAPSVPADAGILDPRTGEHVTSVYRIAQAEPGRTAVIEASGRQVIFGELADAAHGYARGLQALGLTAGDGIAPSDVEVVGFHGQTVLHRPERLLTVQIGDGPARARAISPFIALPE